MKSLLNLKTLILLVFVFLNFNVIAQNKSDSTMVSKRVLVKMKNGEEFLGKFVNKHGNEITLLTENGEMKLISSNVESITLSEYMGKYRFQVPVDSRYFFGPSAIPLKQGKGYYQNVLVTTNFVNIGVTDNISVGGGVELISLMFRYPIWFFTPKVSFKVAEKVHVGGGLLMLGLASFGTLNVAYGVGTYGTSESNVSLGLGYGIAFGEVSSTPTIMLSGTHRLGKNISLLSENYIFPGNDISGIFGIQGIRILSSKSSFDIGLMVTPESIESSFGIPFVGFARTF